LSNPYPSARHWRPKRRQRIDPDQELIGLGAANLPRHFSGGYPYERIGPGLGWWNFDLPRGKRRFAGAFTRSGSLGGTVSQLAARFASHRHSGRDIIVAVLSLRRFKNPQTIWRSGSKRMVRAMARPICVTLLAGVEPGRFDRRCQALSLALFSVAQFASTLQRSSGGFEPSIFATSIATRFSPIPGILTIRIG